VPTGRARSRAISSTGRSARVVQGQHLPVAQRQPASAWTRSSCSVVSRSGSRAGPTGPPTRASGGHAAGPAGPDGTPPAAPCCRPAVGVQAPPAQAGTRERLLDHVFGVLQVAGDREQLHHQPLVVGLVEGGEVSIARHPLLPDPHWILTGSSDHARGTTNIHRPSPRFPRYRFVTQRGERNAIL
jgi:hypothetical protein